MTTGTMTTMYSRHPDTGKTVIHQLPWGKDSKQLDVYLSKGFTFEPPVEACPELEISSVLVTTEDNVSREGFACPICGKIYLHKGKAYRKHLKKTHRGK